MTRPQLGSALSAAGIAPDGQRLPHLLFSAELSGLLVGGPRAGKQLTWALLDEHAAGGRALEREEAIGELTRRYFVSHGPAQLRDLVWWSGLTQVEVRRGIELAGNALEHTEIGGLTYWFDAALGSPRPGAPIAHLLPNFDEYTVAYTDRSALLHPIHPFRPELFAFSSVLANVVTIRGRVHAAWRRQTGRNALMVEVRPLAELTAAEKQLVAQAAARYARFLGRRVQLAWP
jgi:hypothetical protein